MRSMRPWIPMSGLTSQPPLGSIAAALRSTRRAIPGLNREALETIAEYWRRVRALYEGFESDVRSGTADVYAHEMPGGQYTNLREQARSLGIEERWHEVAGPMPRSIELFGDIVKVTPSSQGRRRHGPDDGDGQSHASRLLDPTREIAFPKSVVSLFKGEIGQPPGGFPQALQRKILKGEKPLDAQARRRDASADFSRSAPSGGRQMRASD